MPTLRPSPLFVASLAAFAASSGATRALEAGDGDGESDKQVCVQAYDKAQTLRQDDELVASREQLLLCARGVCPGFIRKDCAMWLTEVDASMPTVVLSVKDAAGEDMLDVTVTVDGELLVTQIDGKAVSVDPGIHTFRFEAEGREPIEKDLVIHEAAKNRMIEVQFVAGDGATGDGGGASGGSGSVDLDDASESPAMAYVFGGIGLAGLGAFAYFGSQYDGKLDDMDACKPNCPQAEADDASTTRTMAFVSAGVGVVSLGVATYLFSSQPTSAEEANEESASIPRVDLVPVRGGAVGSFGARF